MNVYQIRLKTYLLTDIPLSMAQKKITAFIDSAIGKNEQMLDLHKANIYKCYCSNLFFPQEEDKLYKKDKIYTITIRTISWELAQFFTSSEFINHTSRELKGITVKPAIIKPRFMEMLYSLTPVVLKDEEGYWRSFMGIDEYTYRLKVNLIKKYNQFYNKKIDEDFQLFDALEFINRKPVSCRYKNVNLLGDKVRLYITQHETAQLIGHMALGTGIGEMNARGFGFVNGKYI